MKIITFIDTEVSQDIKRIVDFGAIKSNNEKIHDSSIQAFKAFLRGSDFICGHNIIDHDLKFLHDTLGEDEYLSIIKHQNEIDTLYLSALLFPKRPYHALVKDDKLQIDDLNNPLNDAIKAKDLFYNEVEVFHLLPYELNLIYYSLLWNQTGFSGFFNFLDYKESECDIVQEIKSFFHGKICSNTYLENMIKMYPIELAYCLALIYADHDYSISPAWIIKKYPQVDNIIHMLRGTPCLTGCDYCNEKLDIYKGLKRFFGYDAYREFDGVPLQEQAVQAAINNKSLLAIFPTGGGKSITFQVPALMGGKNTKGLTVVISPLLSLMKDQVDNLEQSNITDAVTINGLLDPLERAQAIKRVEDGDAFILYISPESLRSRTIKRLLIGRKISRFVIDEAHCFSSWGHDFRVDYLFIGDFIKDLCKEKNLEEMIPVSCFTATAKQNVINDILKYFNDKLGIKLDLFTTNSSRKNLKFIVTSKQEDEKYNYIRQLLFDFDCPTIIYVSRTRKVEEICKKLNNDGFNAKSYHGKMEAKVKSENQDAFIKGEVNIMVATSAFGMGVDKKDVTRVIHYDISDSLENYIQEAGRAGRDPKLMAECYILFNEDDLNKHFELLNQSKITIQEIQQVWRAIKNTTKIRSTISHSALEIAREAGWDENIRDIETRVTTAIAALENSGYIKRGLNNPRIYANSILADCVITANEKIEQSKLFEPNDLEKAKRIISKLISSRSRKQISGEIPEARVDYISDHLGIEKGKVIEIINKLREAKVLADAKDLIVYMEDKHSVFNKFHQSRELEKFLLDTLPSDYKSVQNIKELNELAEEKRIEKVNPNNIRNILNFWAIKKIVNCEKSMNSQHHIKIEFTKDKDIIEKEITKRIEIAEYILEYLIEKNLSNEREINFSVLELKDGFNYRMQILKQTATMKEIEDALLYLSRMSVLKIEGGFIVSYNSLKIERIEKDNKIGYKKQNYEYLQRFYDQKIQMIHIVGEYAKKMIEDYNSAIKFVDDYFQLNYNSFLSKYFKGTKDDVIRRSITPTKFKKLFGELSLEQFNIINDKESEYIVVTAGPGSGKTRILVHKLASLLLMEDVKQEQLLMLTFSRAAATEFKKRLLGLIGKSAHYIEIKTFHSYCFDLLGRVGNLEKTSDIIKDATDKIKQGEVELSRITKTVLVIDEAQDMDKSEYELIKAIIDKNDNIRVIAVGDDDQNIYSFRGSNSKYMEEFLYREKSNKYDLIKNYRSKANLVDFTNIFVKTIKKRLKDSVIISNQSDNGKIEIICYQSNQLIIPTVNKMVNEGIRGSTCILTKTNDEALQVVGLLSKNGIKAKLIQGTDTFSLYNLAEIRYFIDELKLSKETILIQEEQWINAKRKLTDKYLASENYYLSERLIKDFEDTTNDYKYQSDFISYVKESKEEDFYDNQGVIVSTIHKSKGWEFNDVIMILSDENLNDDESKRALYVGMTRAKENLIIHNNNNYFEKQINNSYGMVKNLYYKYDQMTYCEANLIVKQLGFKDVYLSYFNNTQYYIKHLVSGESLLVNDIGCLNKYNKQILKFSNKFKEEINLYQKKGYQLKCAKVKYTIYWKDETIQNEIMILLPVIEFVKINEN